MLEFVLQQVYNDTCSSELLTTHINARDTYCYASHCRSHTEANVQSWIRICVLYDEKKHLGDVSFRLAIQPFVCTSTWSTSSTDILVLTFLPIWYGYLLRKGGTSIKRIQKKLSPQHLGLIHGLIIRPFERLRRKLRDNAVERNTVKQKSSSQDEGCKKESYTPAPNAYISLSNYLPSLICFLRSLFRVAPLDLFVFLLPLAVLLLGTFRPLP